MASTSHVVCHVCTCVHVPATKNEEKTKVSRIKCAWILLFFTIFLLGFRERREKTEEIVDIVEIFEQNVCKMQIRLATFDKATNAHTHMTAKEAAR